jgi:hypothetical protein
MIEVPDRLMKFKNQIEGRASNQSKQPFTASRWKDWLGRREYHLDIMTDLNYIVDQFPSGLDRKDLKTIAQEAVKYPGLEHYTRLFLASMIWGYGGDREAGYGPWRTAQMMTSDEFMGTLKETSDRLLDGKIGEAYDRFVRGKVKQCRTPFFTKYFYFLGRVVGGDIYSDTYPLILDSRVNEALKSREFVGKNFLVYSRSGRDLYLEYLHFMGEWARRLGCASDDIECFLYEQSASYHQRKTK